MIIVFSIKMKNDIVLSYYWMKGAHLVEDNIYLKNFKIFLLKHVLLKICSNNFFY